MNKSDYNGKDEGEINSQVLTGFGIYKLLVGRGHEEVGEGPKEEGERLFTGVYLKKVNSIHQHRDYRTWSIGPDWIYSVFYFVEIDSQEAI